MPISRSVVVALLAFVGSIASPSLADTVGARRSDRLVETAHEVQVIMDRGHAQLIVRRTVFNGGARHDEIVLVDEARGLTQGDPVANRCLELFVWDLELPDAFTREHEGWQLFIEARAA